MDVLLKKLRAAPKKDMENQLFEKTTTTVNPEKKTIANDLGMSFLQEFEALRAEVASMRADMQDSIMPIRMAALDEWSGWATDPDLANRGNDEAHGGNVVEDIRTIRFMEGVNSDRKAAWALAFYKNYGVSYKLFPRNQPQWHPETSSRYSEHPCLFTRHEEMAEERGPGDGG